MRILIGVDDTDNLESRGTGYRARCLGERLEAEGLAHVESITRHQLLVDPRIPYTSHNSSACLVAEAASGRLDQLAGFCRDYLLRESAPGADAGLCVAAWERVDQAVQAFGRLAKQDVLTHAAALELAQRAGIGLEGLTGTGGGVIGALAGVGLRVEGRDGRGLWLRGLRELTGICTEAQLRQAVPGLDGVESVGGQSVLPSARIDVNDWPRPILRAGRVILLVEEANGDDNCEWRAARKDLIKQLSD